ncbi:MAG: DUF1501 domain-containing protein [Saprospiraceae bacterium]|nr:DUF1501 domain-containing protein [Saprospiraceae bacterium]
MNNIDKQNKITGAALKDGLAHQQHHMAWSRRSFLSTLGLTGGVSVMLGNMPVRAAALSPLGSALLESDSDRVLVLVQLGGGNDGLNTIIPLYDYDFYRSQRPRIGFDETNVIKLSDEIGIQQSMEDFIPLWNEDAMKVAHNVGYPNPNLSHFRATDIWSAASDDDELLKSGWLGRWLDLEYPDFANEPPEVPPAIQIGGYGSLIFNNGMFNLSVSVSNPEELAEIAQNGQLYDTASPPPTCYGEELRFLRTISNSTFTYAASIKEAYDASTTDADYQNIANNLADQLQLVARLIKGNLGSRIYMVSISGFDTHANQNQTHPNIWRGISGAIRSFYDDLQADQMEDKVVTMTFSEFGRRIEENASQGTDHGTSAPILIFGNGLGSSGFVGEAPRLQDQDMYGNLKFGTDFRSIYATLLEHWLCIDAGMVNQALGANYDRIEGLVLGCNLTTAIEEGPQVTQRVSHKPLYNENGDILIQYQLPNSASISLDIYHIDGRKVTSMDQGRKSAGTHSMLFSPSRYHISAGQYLYHLSVDGQPHSQLIMVSR